MSPVDTRSAADDPVEAVEAVEDLDALDDELDAVDAVDAVEVAHRLRLSVTRLARILRQQDVAGLPPTLASALSTVESAGPLTLSDLAAREHVAPPSITKAVDKLETRGLVVRRRDDRDRRVVRVHVTAAGRRVVGTSRSRRTAWLGTRIRELSPDQVACLAQAAELLEQLTRLDPGEAATG